MSRTLFWYIFKDLFRIFMLASGALSAIMSFGGLLRPLYEYGLDVGQVLQILGWSGFPMTAYSLPIAALFATTIVYGRLGADNEVTACRSAGISHLAMTLPAFVLGLFTAFLSLGLLCFVVPSSTLKVERIIYSNLARLITSQIQRSHQIHFEHDNQPITVFAQAANVLDNDPAHPDDQAVRLYGPMIVTYETTEKNRPQIPAEFYMAGEATIFIHQNRQDDDVTISASLVSGTKFPRRVIGATRQQNMQVSVRETQFGPIPMSSPVRENTKFMDIFRLRSMLDAPEQSRRVRSLLSSFIRRDQQQDFLQQMAEQLNGPQGAVQISGSGETYVLTRGSALAELHKDRLIIDSEAGGTPARFVQVRNGVSPLDVQARTIRIKAFPNSDSRQIQIEVEMLDCTAMVGGVSTARENFTRQLTLPMPARVYALNNRPAMEYIRGTLLPDDKQRLSRELNKLINSVISELHARMSFAVSCFILVMVGCALGMMFRSGNFLSAFAVSVVPALISIALIVTGQHTAENVPYNMDPANWNNPLHLGVMLIWSGNAAVLVIGTVLLARLQRQ